MRKADGGHPWTDGEPCRKEVITAALTGVVNEVDIDLIRQYREEILMDDKHLKECQEN